MAGKQIRELTVELRTPRLILRELDERDWAQVHEYATNLDVVRYMEWGPNSEQETKNFIRMAIDLRRKKPRRHFEFAIVDNESSRLIGGCGLTIVDKDALQAAMGYVLHCDFWRRGIGSEAASALMRFGFSELKLHRIFATCDEDNVGSAGVMRKCGMRHEGRFVEERLVKGRWRNTLLYSILEREWQEQHGAKQGE